MPPKKTAFTVTLPSDVHAELQAAAERKDLSPDRYILRALLKIMSHDAAEAFEASRRPPRPPVGEVLPPLPEAQWPEDLTLRRVDMYEDRV